MSIDKEDISLNNPRFRFLVKVLTFKLCSDFNIAKGEWMDCLQEIYLILLSSNYLERWDESKGVDVAPYLRKLILHFIAKKSRRLIRNGNLFSSLDKQLGDSSESFDMHDLLSDASDYEQGLSELSEDIAVLFQQLESLFPYSSCVVYKDTRFLFECAAGNVESFFIGEGYNVYPRSISMIFWLLYRGYIQSEIASFLRVSRPWLSKCVRKIRACPLIREWAGKVKE